MINPAPLGELVRATVDVVVHVVRLAHVMSGPNRTRRQELKMDAFWESHLPSGVPSGLVHYQKDELVLSGSHLLCELPEG